jgi:hypothetical protein
VFTYLYASLNGTHFSFSGTVPPLSAQPKHTLQPHTTVAITSDLSNVLSVNVLHINPELFADKNSSSPHDGTASESPD